MPLRNRQQSSKEPLVPSSLPASVKHLVVGAGVHGLSTAWHLARAGEEVVVVDKTGVAARAPARARWDAAVTKRRAAAAAAGGAAGGAPHNTFARGAIPDLMPACVE